MATPNVKSCSLFLVALVNAHERIEWTKALLSTLLSPLCRFFGAIWAGEEELTSSWTLILNIMLNSCLSRSQRAVLTNRVQCWHCPLHYFLRPGLIRGIFSWVFAEIVLTLSVSLPKTEATSCRIAWEIPSYDFCLAKEKGPTYMGRVAS